MNLKQLRKQNNLTQEEVAERLFLTQHGYSNYELGKTEPNIETLCKLADFYNVTLDYLVGRERTNDLGYLSDTQREIITIMQQLATKNIEKVKIYAQALLDGQNA